MRLQSQQGLVRGIEALEPRDMFAADVVLQWNDVLLDAVRAQRTPPPYATRIRSRRRSAAAAPSCLDAGST